MSMWDLSTNHEHGMKLSSFHRLCHIENKNKKYTIILRLVSLYEYTHRHFKFVVQVWDTTDVSFSCELLQDDPGLAENSYEICYNNACYYIGKGDLKTALEKLDKAEGRSPLWLYQILCIVKLQLTFFSITRKFRYSLSLLLLVSLFCIFAFFMLKPSWKFIEK